MARFNKEEIMPKHDESLYYEALLVSYSEDLEKEAVVTFCCRASDLRKRLTMEVSKLKEQGFSNPVHFVSNVVATPNPKYNKFTVSKITRERVYIYFQYLEEIESKSYCRVAKIKEIPQVITDNMVFIHKNPYQKYVGYSIKEVFDKPRVSLILKRHFESK